MGTLLFITFVGIGGFLIYLYYKSKKLETSYETENPINTQNMTFKKAVEGCCVALIQISELDEKIASIDEIMRKNQNINGSWGNLLSIIFASGVYKKNKKYTDSEKNKKYRIYYRRLLISMIFSPIIFLFASFTPLWLSLVLIGIVLVYLLSALPSSIIRKERKMFPWRYNVQPIGSQMYILQQDFNDALEKTHRLYYDLYLPCKHKADELKVDSMNRESEHYSTYQEVLKYESYMQNCTPMQRIRKLETELKRKEMRRVIKITTVFAVATVAVTAGFISMLNSAGTNMFQSTGYDEKWTDLETHKEYDHNPVNDL